MRRWLERTALCPVVACAVLAEDEVVWAEEGAESARADRVHGARFEVDEDCAGDILVGCEEGNERRVGSRRRKIQTAGLVEIDADALELKVEVAVVAGRDGAMSGR